MKKIVLSSNNCWNIFNFRLALVKKLLEKNYAVYIISKKDDYSDDLIRIGCKLFFLNINRNSINIYSEVILLIKYIYLLLKIKPDFYFAFTIKPNIYGSLACRLLKIKYVNNITGLGSPFIENSYTKKILVLLYKIALKKSIKILFHNKDDKKLFISNKISNLSNSSVIPGSGINLEKVKNININKFPSTPNFLFIGRIIKDKGIHEFLESIEIVKREKPLINFTIIGNIDYENNTKIDKEEFLSKCKKNNVKYFGFTSNIFEHIVNASCIVLPSYREGLPRVILEAGLCARPVIVTDTPGCRDIVTNEFNGLLCYIKDSNHLAQQILKIISLDAYSFKLMGKRNKEVIEKFYDENIISNKYLDLIINN